MTGRAHFFVTHRKLVKDTFEDFFGVSYPLEWLTLRCEMIWSSEDFGGAARGNPQVRVLGRDAGVEVEVFRATYPHEHWCFQTDTWKSGSTPDGLPALGETIVLEDACDAERRRVG